MSENKECCEERVVECVTKCEPKIVKCIKNKLALTTWRVNFLVANRPNQAAHVDPTLSNPWGIAIYNNLLWVLNNSTDSLANYDFFGNRKFINIRVRDAIQNSSFPTGIALNSGGGFSVISSSGGASGLIIAVTEHGTVHAANPLINAETSFVVINQQATGNIHVYTGVSIVNKIMYVADFFGRKIDVYNDTFDLIFGYPFIDEDTSDPIPDDFAPFNIVNFGCYLFVLWAKKNPIIRLHAIDGPSQGYISVFNLDGTFVGRFYSRGVLNTPWAMIRAPCEYGFPPGSFLVANHGNGKINIFDQCGRFISSMLNQEGKDLVLPGIWGLAEDYRPPTLQMPAMNQIFFTSAPATPYSGLVGSLVKDNVFYIDV